MKALIISYYWPPSGGSGVQRWLYFSKYMSEFGIEPTIVTVSEKQASYSSVDESLNQEVLGIRVFKTNTLEPIRFYSFLKSGNIKKSIPQGNIGGKKPGMIDKIARFIRANYFLPDARVGWNPYAFKKAKQLLETEHFDFIITTGPPQSTHLVGLKLKRLIPNTCWIADFRDPWTEVYYNDLFKRTKSKSEKDIAMELTVLTESDLVLTVGPSMKKLLQSKIKENKDKVKFIFNGFDINKLRNAKVVQQEMFTIAYVGTLSSNYPYKSFISALEKLEKSTGGKKIRLILAGKIENDVICDFKSIATSNLIVDFKGSVIHSEALSIMKSANLLFLCLPIYEGSSIFVSGKLMEYAACKTPILGILSPTSDASYLIENYTQGKVFLPEQQDEIVDFLTANFKGTMELKVGLSNIDTFERKSTAKELVDLLTKIIAR